jgi:hypothetical protein
MASTVVVRETVRASTAFDPRWSAASAANRFHRQPVRLHIAAHAVAFRDWSRAGVGSTCGRFSKSTHPVSPSVVCPGLGAMSMLGSRHE